MKAIKLLGFIVLFSLYHCQEKKYETEVSPLTQKIIQTADSKLSPTNADSVFSIFKESFHKAQIQNDTLALAISSFNMAKLMAMKKNDDSAKMHIDRAAEFIENTWNTNAFKARIYNGMGIVYDMKKLNRQANFYFNKSGNYILRDKDIDLTAENKLTILNATVQSNIQNLRYDLAEKYQHKALEILPQIKEKSQQKFQIFHHTINLLNKKGAPLDSLKYYLAQMESLYKTDSNYYKLLHLKEAQLIYYNRAGLNDLRFKTNYDLLQFYKATFQKNENNTSFGNMYMGYINMANDLVSFKKFDVAKKYLDSASMFSKKYHIYFSKNHNELLYHNALANYYYTIGQYQKAAALRKTSFDLQSEITFAETTEAIAEMNALYQLQIQERNIKKWQEEATIKRLQLSKNRLWLFIALLVSLILIATVAILLYFQKNRKKNEAREKMLLQQQLLRTQMEPHFIFNTIASLQSFIRLGQTDMAIKYLNQFSKLLRDVLEHSRESTVSVQEEISTLKTYLTLQQMRFNNAFTFNINATQLSDIDDMYIPPMLIQPMVENAIMHGTDFQKENNAIDIRFTQEVDLLLVEISDCGKEKTFKATHRSLSGNITRERLQHLGKNAKIEIKNNDFGGTTVILQIPFEWDH